MKVKLSFDKKLKTKIVIECNVSVGCLQQPEKKACGIIFRKIRNNFQNIYVLFKTDLVFEMFFWKFVMWNSILILIRYLGSQMSVFLQIFRELDEMTMPLRTPKNLKPLRNPFKLKCFLNMI